MVPVLEPGNLTVRVFRDSAFGPTLEELVEAPKPAVLFLSFSDLVLFPEFELPWLTQLIFDEGTDSTARDLIGERSSDASHESDLALLDLTLAARGVDLGGLETLVAWVKEYDQNRYAAYSEGEDWPISSAYEYSRTERGAIDAVWDSTPAEKRLLDPDLTPTRVLEGLEAIPLFIEIAPEAAVEGKYLIVRNSVGVSRIVELVHGSHPDNVLAPVGETLEFIIASDRESGVGVSIGMIEPQDWLTAPAVLVQVLPEHAALPYGEAVVAGITDAARALSGPEAAGWIDDLASSGR